MRWEVCTVEPRHNPQASTHYALSRASTVARVAGKKLRREREERRRRLESLFLQIKKCLT